MIRVVHILSLYCFLAQLRRPRKSQRFKFHTLSSKILKIPEFNLNINLIIVFRSLPWFRFSRFHKSNQRYNFCVSIRDLSVYILINVHSTARKENDRKAKKNPYCTLNSWFHFCHFNHSKLDLSEKEFKRR